uniref:Uncharacterized protein n=1 Tax=Mola mola TaxID=94237 RepID=A0A3Q3VVK5_MOLML
MPISLFYEGNRFRFWQHALSEVRWLSRGKVLNKVFELREKICQFVDMKLRLWETQMQRCNLSRFLSEHTMHYEFARRFGDFEVQKNNFELLRNPFAAEVETAPVHIQTELIELQCNGTLKAQCDTVGPAQFPRFTPETTPQVLLHGARSLCAFGTTYLFSVMKMNQSSHRRRLTDVHLQAIMRISTSQNLTSNINKLVTKKRCQATSSHKMA